MSYNICPLHLAAFVTTKRAVYLPCVIYKVQSYLHGGNVFSFIGLKKIGIETQKGTKENFKLYYVRLIKETYHCPAKIDITEEPCAKMLEIFQNFSGVLELSWALIA